MDDNTVWLRYIALWTKGMSQDAIANRAGVSQGTVSRWVNGRKLPTEAAKVAAFARGFNRNVLEAFVAARMITVDEARGGLAPDSVDLLRSLHGEVIREAASDAEQIISERSSQKVEPLGNDLIFDPSAPADFSDLIDPTFDQVLEFVRDDDEGVWTPPAEPSPDDQSLTAQADRIHRDFGTNFYGMLRFIKRRREEGVTIDPGVELELRRRARAYTTEMDAWEQAARESTAAHERADGEMQWAMAEVREVWEHNLHDFDVVLDSLRNMLADETIGPDTFEVMVQALERLQLAVDLEARDEDTGA